MHSEAILFLAVGALLAGSVLTALAAVRLSVPFLVIFLGIGMLLGADGMHLFQLPDVELVRTVGVAALALILFEGGMSTSFRRLRTVARAAVLLSTVGVVVTAVGAGLLAHWLFGWPWLESFLLGAVVSSTDAAAIFATLRQTQIRRYTARVLEAESGLNDPMAIALTLGLITWVLHPATGAGAFLVLLAQQLGIGLIVGAGMGFGAMKIFSRMPTSVGSFAPVASLATCALTYGLADALGGSGFMAVYLVGLAIGSTPSRYRGQLTVFHEGIAFLSQVLLFVILGLFAVPHDLLKVALPSLALALGLVVVIRPLAVWVATWPLRFTSPERLLVSWAGLKGAVPIVFATIVLASGVPHGRMIFDVVFFVVILSTVLQGTTLTWFAARLGLIEPPDVPAAHAPLSKPAELMMIIRPSYSIAGVMLKEIGLPPWARVARVVRGKHKRQLRADMVLEADDVMFVTYPPDLQPELDDVVSRWRRRI
ncbi:MAG: potassium/proton antiporter [Candidatus Saccharimonadales bacterium]